MMSMSTRRFSLGPLVAAAALVAPLVSSWFVACSSSVPRQSAAEEPRPEAGRPPVTGVDGGAPLDSSVPDVDPRPPFDPSDEPVVCTAAPCAVELAAGAAHFCARMSDGTVRCWGNNVNGELGGAPSLPAPDAGAPDASDPDAGDSGAGDPDASNLDASSPPSDASALMDAGSRPIQVTGLAGVTQVSAGGTTTCARLGDGAVRCWGGNDRGQLGLENPAVSDALPHPLASPVALGGPATRVDVGQRTACAILASGEVHCWGSNAQLLLARTDIDGGVNGAPERAQLGSAKIARTAAGTDTAFAVTTTGDLLSWGAVAGNEGIVAARVASLSPDPRPLPLGISGVTSFSVSSTTMYQPPGSGFPRPPVEPLGHACAVARGGQLYCWGGSNGGALGTGLPDPSKMPTRARVVSDKGYPQQVTAAGEITCVRLTDGTIQCAGDDARGALGRGTADKFSMFFVPAKAFTGRAVQVAAARAAVCALAQGGTVSCWGSNELGELGLGTRDTAAHPTPAPIRF